MSGIVRAASRPGLVALLAALAVAWGCASGPAADFGASPPAGSLFLYPERIPLGDGTYTEAERGILFVPANRSNPASGVLAIEIYRFRAAPGADPATPPIFRLYGGPNFPGLEAWLDPEYYDTQIRPYREVADFVVVGQRGIGSSKPNTVCEPPRPVALDATLEERADALRDAAERCRSFWAERGLDLKGLNVLEAAADVNDVRRALGYDRIQLWGGSFGSHWAMAVMRVYPETVVRAVLRGLEGPDHTYDMPSGVLEGLAGIAAAADTATALAGHIPPAGLMATYKEIIHRLEQQPVTVTVETEETGGPVTVTVDADAVRAVALFGGAAGWPRHVLAMHKGDFTTAARALVRDRLRPGYQTASYFMLDCGSGISPERDARLRSDPAIRYVGDLGWWYRTNCAVWDSDLGDDFRRNFDTDIPTVLVHGDWDTSTPLANALELAPHFRNSRLVIVRGGSHGALIEAMEASPEFHQAILHFFTTGDMSRLPDEVVLPPVRWAVP